MIGQIDLKQIERRGLADQLVGSVLRDERADIPPEHLKWLRRFLREHLGRGDYRLVSDGFDWLKKPLPAGCALRAQSQLEDSEDQPYQEQPAHSASGDHALDDDIPF